MKKLLIGLFFFPSIINAVACNVGVRNDLRRRIVYIPRKHHYRITVGLNNNKKFIFNYDDKSEAQAVYNDLIKHSDSVIGKTVTTGCTSLTFYYNQVSYFELTEV